MNEKLFKKVKTYYREGYKMGHFPSIWKLLFSRKEIIAYYGFLGDGNFGDELVFEATNVIFRGQILLPIKKRMPPFSKVFSRIFRSRISGIVIGGGTLIGPFWEEKYVRSILSQGKPVFVHGTGVRSTIERKESWEKLFGQEVYGGVRGPLSKKNINEITTTVDIVGDAAFTMFDEEKMDVDKKVLAAKKVLVNFGTHADFVGKKYSRNEVGKFVGELLTKGFTVNFIPFHNIDVKLGYELKEVFPEITVLGIPKSYEEGLELFKDSTFAIGERLHFIVMALLSFCPFTSINYAEKHEDLLLSLNISKAGFLPSNLSCQHIKNAFQGRENFDWEAITESIQAMKLRQFTSARNFLSSIKLKG